MYQLTQRRGVDVVVDCSDNFATRLPDPVLQGRQLQFPANHPQLAQLGIVQAVSANEVAVAAFLDRKIGFMDIARIVEACCDQASRESNGRAPSSVAEALEIDHMSRERARALLN